MKPHPRIRKTIKWGGAAGTLPVQWIKFGFIAAVPPLMYISVYLIALAGWTFKDSPTAFYGIQLFALLTEPWLTMCGGPQERLAVLIALVQYGLIGTAIAYFLRRRVHASQRSLQDLCRKCHYNRTGLAAGAVCPECGAASTPS